MKFSYLVVPLRILVIFTYSFSDEIFLTNGQKATITVVDTNGCEVKLLRNGNTVSISKDNIDKLIVKTDTVSYSGYTCGKRTVIRYEIAPESILRAMLDSAGELTQAYKENSRVAFCNKPLEGNFNADDFTDVLSLIMDLFKLKSSIDLVGPSEILTDIQAEQHKYDYVFFTRKFHVEMYHFKESGFLGPPSLSRGSGAEKEKELITIANFIILNIKKKEIIYHKILTEKRTTWRSDDEFFTKMFTSEEWQRECKKKKTDRQLDLNAQAIQRKMKKDLSEYLEIKQ